MQCLRERDTDTLNSLLTSHTQLLSNRIREKIISSIKSEPPLLVNQEGYVKVFNKGNGLAEATAQIKIDTKSGPRFTIGNFRLIKEANKWKFILFGIKTFGLDLD